MRDAGTGHAAAGAAAVRGAPWRTLPWGTLPWVLAVVTALPVGRAAAQRPARPPRVPLPAPTAPIPLLAGEAATRPRLDLATALRVAAERQPLVAGARAGASAAAARATAARALLFPQVGVGADLTGTTQPTRIGRSAGLATGAPGDSAGGPGTPGGGGSAGGGAGGSATTNRFRTNFAAAATLQQAVFEPRLRAEVSAARAGQRAAEADARQVSLDVGLGVVDAYFAQVRAEQLVRVQEDQVRLAARDARDLAAREAQGAGRRVDALRADVQRALAEVALREARAVAAQAAAGLVATLGTRDSAYALDTTLVLPGAVPASPAALDSLGAIAERASPTLQAFAALAEQQRAFARAARADLLPTLSARVGAGYQQSDLNPRAAFTTLGLSLGWPAFTSGAVQALARAAEAEARVAEAEAESARLELRRRLAAALARWREAERRTNAATASVGAAREALDILTAAFREGAVLLVEVFQARADLARAESGRVQALVDARVASAEVALTLGREPLP